MRVLIELAEDKRQKGSTRGAAAKALVHFSGSTAPILSQEDLAGMSAEQIQRLLDEARRALATREAVVKTIDHVPKPDVSKPPRMVTVKVAPLSNVFD